MPTIFLTGFPGFLGSALIERLLARHAHEVTITCLVQPKFRTLAEERVTYIEAKQSTWQGRINLCEGDITQPDLGLGDKYSTLQQASQEIYHLAAVYDLAVPRHVGLRINLNGTRHMLDFATGCPDLQRFQYVSTCYVSGNYDGLFTETDLQVGQRFNNYYEETKYLAEIEVQSAMQHGLPTTIYRPSIVTGDSRTGVTQKYDGPYYVLQWLLRQPRWAVLPTTGNPRRYYTNMVPCDFVIDALDYLSGLPQSAGRVYQLCDPNPPTVNTAMGIMAEATQRQLIKIPLPKWVAKGSLERLSIMQDLMRIEPETVEYFVQPTRYDCRQTQQDLAGTDIACPPFASYIHRLVAYMEQYPDVSTRAMV
ncbi:SDR family oxidoreductase [Anaerolineales bacterium HSG6]|nr:SDR family oxidoreductase [Anaerolineales bacterium HSG6]